MHSASIGGSLPNAFIPIVALAVLLSGCGHSPTLQEHAEAACTGPTDRTFFTNLNEAGVTGMAQQDEVFRAAWSVCETRLRDEGFVQPTTTGDTGGIASKGEIVGDRSAQLLADIHTNFSATSWGQAIRTVSSMGDTAIVRITDPTAGMSVCKGVSSLVFASGSSWSGIWVQGPNGNVLAKRESPDEPC